MSRDKAGEDKPQDSKESHRETEESRLMDHDRIRATLIS